LFRRQPAAGDADHRDARVLCSRVNTAVRPLALALFPEADGEMPAGSIIAA
jgi:hypothetical protein